MQDALKYRGNGWDRGGDFRIRAGEQVRGSKS